MTRSKQRAKLKSKSEREPSFAAFFHKVSTLEEYVDALVDGHTCKSADVAGEFRRFLRTTMVGHDPISTKVTFYEPVESLTDTTLKVIKRMLKRSPSSSTSNLANRFGQNTLAMGFDLRREGGMNCVGGDSSVTNHFINSSVVELTRGRWIQLLNRIGTEAMSHLLLYASVFLPLQNSGFCQISGTPLVSAPLPNPQSIKSASSTFRLPVLPTAFGKRKRADDDAGGGSRCKIQRADSGVKLVDESCGLQGDAGTNQPLSLSAISIVRGRMLFNTPISASSEFKWKLPLMFPLNRCTLGAELVQDIFSKSRDFAASPPLYLVKLATRMLKLHRKFNYRLRLFNTCPAPWQKKLLTPDGDVASMDCSSQPVSPYSGAEPMDTSSDTSSDTVSTTEAEPNSKLSQSADQPSFLEMASSHKDVYIFLQRCVNGVIPRDLIGGKNNHRRLYTLLRRLVSAGRFEELTLHEAMQRFRLCEVSSWLDCKLSSVMDIYASLIYWIIVEFAMRLVAKFFYVTEGSNSRHRLFFFRNDVWQSISRDAWKHLERNGMYAPKSHAEIASNTTRQHFGCSRIRLLPKERGFRAIVNMRRSFIFKRRFPVGPGNEFNKVQVISTNRQLADFQAALRPWCIAHPELFGSATFGPSDIYAKLKQFKESLSNVPTFGTERLYVAKLDIHHAFDTIPQERLLALLQTHLPDEEMMVHKYWTMTPSFSRFRSSFLRHGQAASDPTMFCELARGLSVRGKGLVFGDQSATAYFHTRNIYHRIAEHISQNIVKSHAQLLHQQRGIPQGSVLSSFLCNFFYGQLEQQYLAPLVSPQSTLMLRVIDDFLIVSTDRTQVVAVIERMSQGISEYGCRLNTAKTLVNFELKINGQPVLQTDSPEFPWCGMLINDCSLDVMVDYSRLSSPIRLDETITINAGKQAGKMLRQKMLAAVRIKVHQLYTDVRFNSRQTVLLNLYQNFLLCAKKFHLICRHLPARAANHQYYVSVIEDTIAMVHILLKCNSRESSIASRDIKWLGAHAFYCVLKRKQSRYPLLLLCLDKALRRPEAAVLAQVHATVVNSPCNSTVLSIGY